MASASKQRKVDSENRQWNVDFTENFCFILPSNTTRPLCLICQETVAVVKAANIRRHFESKHKNFNETYPLKSSRRSDKLKSLQNVFERSKIIMSTALTSQQKAYGASLRVAYILNKKLILLSHSEIVKECLIAVSNEMFNGTKKEEVTNVFETIPLSNDSNTRRLEEISGNLKEQVIKGV